MAAVQISGAVWPPALAVQAGPYIDGSDLYVVAIASISSGQQVYKSTDGGGTWATYLTASSTTGVSASVFDSANRILYTFTGGASNSAIWKYDLAAGTKAAFAGSGPALGTDANSQRPAFLARRSTGEFVVFYQGPTHSLMGTPYRACYYARCSSAGVWSSAVETSGAVKLHHYDCKGAVLGASDRSHFLYTDAASGTSTLTHRSLSSANAFGETPGASVATIFSNLDFFSIYYDATLAKVVVGPNDDSGQSFKPYRADSGAGQTWTADSNGPGDVEPCPPAFIYEPTGANLYIFYRDATSDDVYYNTAPSTTWGTAAAQDTATAVTGISVGLITNAIGVVFNDSGVYFDKLSLSSGTTYPKSGYAVESAVA